MKLADLIAGFIREVLEEMDGVAELNRGEIAKQFHCAPSQINYVIATRFSPERGYFVESRRGGGGYIRVTQAAKDCNTMVNHVLCSIGGSIDFMSIRAIVSNLNASGVLTEEQARMIEAATSDASLRPVLLEQRDTLRASILKQMLLQIICVSREGKSE